MKTEQTRDYDSEMGPTYICGCGTKFKFKFRDYNLCGKCLEPIMKEISKKMNTKMNLTNNYYKI